MSHDEGMKRYRAGANRLFGEAYHQMLTQRNQQERTARALQRLANVLCAQLDPRKANCELLEELADAAEELLTDAIIRDRL